MLIPESVTKCANRAFVWFEKYAIYCLEIYLTYSLSRDLAPSQSRFMIAIEVF